MKENKFEARILTCEKKSFRDPETGNENVYYSYLVRILDMPFKISSKNEFKPDQTIEVCLRNTKDYKPAFSVLI